MTCRYLSWTGQLSINNFFSAGKTFRVPFQITLLLCCAEILLFTRKVYAASSELRAGICGCDWHFLWRPILCTEPREDLSFVLLRSGAKPFWCGTFSSRRMGLHHRCHDLCPYALYPDDTFVNSLPLKC